MKSILSYARDNPNSLLALQLREPETVTNMLRNGKSVTVGNILLAQLHAAISAVPAQPADKPNTIPSDWELKKSIRQAYGSDAVVGIESFTVTGAGVVGVAGGYQPEKYDLLSQMVGRRRYPLADYELDMLEFSMHLFRARTGKPPLTVQ